MNRFVDSFNRRHTYLRISLTDRCNLRCRYCTPPDGIQSGPKDELLSFDEIEVLARVLGGGVLGSWVGALWLQARTLQSILGILLIMAGAKLIGKLFIAAG
ncbi:MAG: hypothetical protein WBG01_02810 [Bacteroidota bacterium]